MPYHTGAMIVNGVDAVVNGTVLTGGKLVSEKLKTGQWSCWTGARHSCVAVSTRYFTQANVAPVYYSPNVTETVWHNVFTAHTFCFSSTFALTARKCM